MTVFYRLLSTVGWMQKELNENPILAWNDGKLLVDRWIHAAEAPLYGKICNQFSKCLGVIERVRFGIAS